MARIVAGSRAAKNSSAVKTAQASSFLSASSSKVALGAPLVWMDAFVHFDLPVVWEIALTVCCDACYNSRPQPREHHHVAWGRPVSGRPRSLFSGNFLIGFLGGLRLAAALSARFNRGNRDRR